MPNIERNKRIIFNGVEMDYVVAINLIVDAWGKIVNMLIRVSLMS